MTENQKLREACNYIDALGGDSRSYRQALALPTAAPVGELPELPLPTSIPGLYDIEASKRCVYTADQMRAYATAAVQQHKDDAQRWKTSELISRAALTHPDKRTEQMNIAFNAYRKAMESGQSYAACVDAAIDAAMRKGPL